MIRRPPRSTRTDTLFPYTTLFRSYAGIDIETALRIGKSAALAPPPLFGCACLFVNDRRDALYLSKLSLEGVQIVAVHHIGTDCLVMPLARIVAHEADGLDPLGAQLRDDAKRVDRAFCRLATCHPNSIIIEDLESDIERKSVG